MESTTLLEFFNDLNAWPGSDAELDVACGWLSKLTGAPFTALYLVDAVDMTKVAYRMANAGAARPPAELVREFLKRQIGQPPTEKGQLRQVQIARDSQTFPGLETATHLSLMAVSSELRGNVGQSAARLASFGLRKDRVWACVAFPRAPDAKDQIVIVSFAQHLAHLAERQQLEGMVQLRNQFLSIASHELKTPLTSIYGMLQLQERMIRLKKDATPDPQRDKQHQFLKMVIRQVERLNELIDGLLDVSRIQAGRFAVDPAELDMAALLRDLVSARLTVIAGDAGVRLNVDAPEKLMAWLDPVRAEEVVTNLVMNAIRFSPEGGAIWIRLGSENGSLRLTIRDQGPSVPMEDRERIFQPFERAQRTSRFGGLGLGLFISRQIAQLHGGNVSLVESIPGKGNVFEAYFPIRSVSLVSA